MRERLAWFDARSDVEPSMAQADRIGNELSDELREML